MPRKRHVPEPPVRSSLEQSRAYAAMAEEQFMPTGGGAKSLMRTISARLPKPPTCRSALYKLARKQMKYSEFIGRLMAGWSLTAAAVAMGVSRSQVRAWLAQGLNDQMRSLDTYYSRFAFDVYAAIAHAVGECEARIHMRQPLEYLRTGPGRAFYAREGYWREELAGYEENELDPPTEEQQDSSEEMLPDESLLHALSILRESGVDANGLSQAISAQVQRASLPPHEVQQCLVSRDGDELPLPPPSQNQHADSPPTEDHTFRGNEMSSS